MFELAQSSPFFEFMNNEEPILVQNIEVVSDNKINMDACYHNPKKFILELNNLLKSTIFFVETAIKNSPEWLRNAAHCFREENREDYEILKHLRNTSAHQSLVFPKEAFASGLYRIQSETSYKQKIGIGDHDRPNEYSWDLAFRNTSDLFHDILVFQSIAFMDLEHSALWECLGVTRRWFFHVKFKSNNNTIDKVVDVYKLTSDFATKLLDKVCSAYAIEKNIKHESLFYTELSECNFVNTLLEIDLYPSLFSKWWEEDWKPLNFGVLVAMNESEQYHWMDTIHKDVYHSLPSQPSEYKLLLEELINTQPENVFNKDNALKFYSFIKINHWHVKSAFKSGLMDTPVDVSDILKIQRLGNIFMNELRKKRQCTIASSYENLREHLKIVQQNLTKF